MAKGVQHYYKDGRKYNGETHKMPDGSVHTGKTHTKGSKVVVHFKIFQRKQKKKPEVPKYLAGRKNNGT